jgi:predicted permease
MLLDLRHLVRSLRRSPATAAAAVLTLSLTIGAVASIYALMDAVLLTPPPVADPAALVVVGERPVSDTGQGVRTITYTTFEAWRERARAIAAFEAFDGTNVTLTGLGAAERLSATDVTPGFLSLLGVTPAIGRTFSPDDEGQPVVIVTDAFWRGRLASDPAVIGRSLVLSGRSHTIVGVLPARFSFALDAAGVWRPLPLTAVQASQTGYRVRVIARLHAGVSPASLAAALDDVSRMSVPEARAIATHIVTAIAGNNATRLGLLAAAAGVALLVAFTNLAGLLMVRSIDRQRELAVRTALGAARSEVARQLLLETAALVALGIAGGVLLAIWMTPTLARLVLEQNAEFAGREIGVSTRVIGVVAVIAAACAVVCAAVPAHLAGRRSILDVLRRGATAPPRELTVRRLFVIAEVALAFVLLVSMALLGRALLAVIGTYPGFDVRGVLTLQLSLPRAAYPTDGHVASFYSSLESALRERLGARAVATVDELPLTGDRGRSVVSHQASGDGPEAVVRTVSSSYFDVMRIPLVSGRPFDRDDTASAPPRVVVSRALAERLFPSEPAVGRQVWLAAREQMSEIVGVVGDVKHRALDESQLLTVYVSALQAPSPSSVVVVRSNASEPVVAAVVREEVTRMDGSLPVYNVRLMPEVVARSPGIAARRMLTAAFSGFALLALVLSAMGLFGIVAHDVASRRPELALRIALGAEPFRMLWSTLRNGASMIGAGLVAGGVLSIWATSALRGMLLTGDGIDVAGILVAVSLLGGTGLVAILPGALRAVRTDPLLVLRGE